MLKRLKNHFLRWNAWRKRNLNSWLWKILVLIGIGHSPTFEFYCPGMPEWEEKRK